MRVFFAAVWLGFCCLPARAQQQVPLPGYTYRYQAPKDYRWKKILEDKHRSLLYNAVFSDDTTLYSFGGFDLKQTNRSLFRVENGKLIEDTSFHYPGRGAIYNIAFASGPYLYIGGGHDSNAARYAELDFYRYDRRARIWTRLNDLPFYYRHWTNHFQYAGRHYFLVPVWYEGREQGLPVLYVYDEQADSWVVGGPTLPDKDLVLPQCFQLGADIYGLFEKTGSPGSVSVGSLWKFNMDTLRWTELPFPQGAFKTMAMTFSDGRYGYLVGGSAPQVAMSKVCWRFDPQTLKWERLRDFPRLIRHGIAWTFQGECYVGFGVNEADHTTGIWKLVAP